MPSRVLVRPALQEEHGRLREITIASRGIWGYDAERFRAWAEQLDLSEVLTGSEAYVAEHGGRLVGWACLRATEAAELAELWVEPAHIGTGIGSQLFRCVAERARELGAPRLVWGAEPGAVGFYEKMGGRKVGELRSRSFDIVITRMALDLP